RPPHMRGRTVPLGVALPCCFLAVAAPAQTVSTAPVIGAIRVVERKNVFDLSQPGEDWWIFRIANKIHFTTLEPVVRREVLLSPGAPFDELKVLESERNLRAAGSFRWAEIQPRPRPDGRVDLEVRTQDSWTTNPRFAIGTEGGERYYRYGIEESNLLGRNKSIAFFHSANGEKTRDDLRYTDPRLAGTRLRLSALLASTDHGDSAGADLARPFFSLETPYAYGLGWTRFNDEDILYQGGEEATKFRDYSRTAMLGAAARLPWTDDLTQRAEAGWLYQRSRFTPAPDSVHTTLPANRELSGPTLGYSLILPRYVKETYLDRMERVEDYNLGHELNFLGGLAAQKLSSDRDRLFFNLTDQQGLGLGPGRFALAQAGMAGRVAGGTWENALFFANLDAFFKSERPLLNTWVAHLEAATVRRMDRENQVVLGGDTGLRGYKNNAFTGARSVLANVENRFFFPGEYLHLVRFGGAVFFDSGAVADESGGLSLARFKSDVGAGLRLSSTRSRSGGVLRVDLAYALDRGPGPSRWVVSIRSGQAFDIFNSATRRFRRPPTSRLGQITPPDFPNP
ncbi:MAG: BamA/TamA family outer membrane protein, partial [Elusimicrobia bacterium]|nr:BamA/TamA family outer membrane protein [Elusimicrobiota bacterium]